MGIAQTFNIPTIPTHGIIDLASASHSLPRTVRTKPIQFVPILVHNTLQRLRLHPITCSFEVMDLHRDKYQFIIGLDLIHIIFSHFDSVPLKYLPQVEKDDDIITSSSTTITQPTSSLIHASIPISTSSSSTSIGPMSGSGFTPIEEEPIRVSTSTPAELEQQYSIKRNQILSSSAIIDALRHNEAITGFCNIPEATLKLKLDPNLSSPAQLYARQYPLSQRAIEAAQVTITRWFKMGKIIRAPAGCPYNNPLTVAPKEG